MAKRTSDGPAVSTGERRGDSSDNVPTHSVSLSLLAKSRTCHTPVRRGEVTVESLRASHVESISYQHIKPAERTDLNFTRGTLSSVSEISNTKLLVVVTFIWQMQPF